MRAPARSAGRRRTWCGPYALAVILGLDYDEAYDLAKKITRKVKITGMHTESMIAVLKRKGIRTDWARPWGLFGKEPTLRKLGDWLKPRRLYLVNVTSHYVVVDTSDWSVIDIQGWWPIDRHWCAGRKVKRIAEIRRVANPTEN